MAKTYDLEEIQEGILGTREGNNYFLLAYPPKRRMTDVSRLIWDLKENQPYQIHSLLWTEVAKGKWDPYARRRFHEIRDSSRMWRYPEEALGLSEGYRAFRGENRL